MSHPMLLNCNPGADQADLLSRQGVQSTLLMALETIPAPGCIALYGAWGVGKSTVLRHAKAAYTTSHADAALLFDPWEYERREDLLSPLLYALVSHIRAHGGPMDEVWSVARRIARTLAGLAVRIGSKRLLDLELSVEDLQKQLDAWSRYHDEIAAVKTDFKALVKLALGNDPDSRFVFFLDDLDRCLPDSVVEVLEGVKLLLCGNEDCRALFVFALDRQVVGEAIAGRYPGATSYSGETYLEKIFDLSLEVPPVARGSVKTFLEAQWSGPVLETVEARFACIGGFEQLGFILQEPAFANPRVIKRVANRLILLFREQETQRWASALNEPARRRFLTWVAGAERFRSFRYAFLAAAEDELLELFDAVRNERAFGGNNALGKLTGLPDFRWYLNQLGMLQHTKATLKTERNPEQALSLRQLDERLRASGL